MPLKVQNIAAPAFFSHHSSSNLIVPIEKITTAFFPEKEEHKKPTIYIFDWRVFAFHTRFYKTTLIPSSPHYDYLLLTGSSASLIIRYIVRPHTSTPTSVTS